MKKIIIALMLLSLFITAFAGCNPNQPTQGGLPAETVDPPADVEGPPTPQHEIDTKSLVHLLLASERLDEKLLKNEGNIFDTGKAVMTGLSEGAISFISTGGSYASASGQPARLTSLSNTATVGTVYDGGDKGGLVTNNGTTYLFSDFVEISNSVSSFEATANSVSEMANEAASLIEDIQKNVRIVDKWITVDGFKQLHLHVGEDEEVLFSRLDAREELCRRYKNEKGQNVYEFIMFEGKFCHHMIYIPNVRFEVFMGDPNDRTSGDYSVASNEKGYWEYYWVGVHPTHYNVSYMSLKDDICYDSFYSPKTGEITTLKVISADRKTDLFYYFDYGEDAPATIELALSGFEGYEGIRTEASNVDMPDFGGEIGRIPMTTDHSKNVLVMKNGKEATSGDIFAQGKVVVDRMFPSFFSGHYTANLILRVDGDGYDGKLANLNTFLGELGLVCRRDINEVLSGVERAFVELKEITKYHTWNGFNQSTEEGIAAATEIAAERTFELAGLFDEVRDAEFIDLTDIELPEVQAILPDIAISNVSGVTHSGLAVTIGSITLSTDNTFLLREGEAFRVGFALSGESGLVHLNLEGTPEIVLFDGSESITLSAQGLSFTIPELDAGTYTLVTYIAFESGVRTSQYKEFKLDSIDSSLSHHFSRSKVTAAASGEGALTLTYTEVQDMYFTHTRSESLDYQGLRDIISTNLCTYGIPGDTLIERVTDEATNACTPLTGTETIIEDGIYRLEYSIVNGDKVISGYAYLTLMSAEEQPPVTEGGAE